MEYNVRTDDDTKAIINNTTKENAYTFARLYSAGSEDRPSCRVWVFKVEPMVYEKPIAVFSHGDLFERIEE